MNKHAKLVRSSCKKALRTTTPKLKAFAVVLVAMVLSELYLNNDAVSQLLETKEFGPEAYRSMLIALFLTVIIVSLNFYGGNCAKRYFEQKRRGVRIDASMLVFSVVSMIASIALILVISFIRYTVGSDAGTSETSEILLQAVDSSAGDAKSFSMPEVVLLAAVLLASAVFSYMYSFIHTAEADVKMARDIQMADLDACLKLSEADFARSETFMHYSEQLLEAEARRSRARASDRVTKAVLCLCDDPAIATNVCTYLQNPPE